MVSAPATCSHPPRPFLCTNTLVDILVKHLHVCTILGYALSPRVKRKHPYLGSRCALQGRPPDHTLVRFSWQHRRRSGAICFRIFVCLDRSTLDADSVRTSRVRLSIYPACLSVTAYLSPWLVCAQRNAAEGGYPDGNVPDSSHP